MDKLQTSAVGKQFHIKKGRRAEVHVAQALKVSYFLTKFFYFPILGEKLKKFSFRVLNNTIYYTTKFQYPSFN